MMFQIKPLNAPTVDIQFHKKMVVYVKSVEYNFQKMLLSAPIVAVQQTILRRLK